MAPRSSLSRHCNWGMVLSLLGSDTTKSSSLPARATCPLCAAITLQVYKDVVLGGQWYWCAHCGFAGDTIELASAAWKVGPVSAVLRLRAAGTAFPDEMGEDTILEYVSDHINLRRRVNALWAEALATTTPLEGALGTFGRGLGIPAVRPRDWGKRGGQFVGILDRMKVVQCFQPAQGHEPNHKGEQGGHRTFKGKGWGQLVVIPHWDLPGRIRGFLLVGREAKAPDDYVYRRVPANPHVEHKHGAGVSMLSTVLTTHPKFGEVVFACTDPVEALRLQLTHLAEHSWSLPLVGTWGDQPSPAWEALPDRPVVVFGPSRTAAESARVVRQVRGLAGRVGRLRLPMTIRPEVALRAADRDAIDWRSFLEGQLKARQPDEAERLFHLVGLEHGVASRFLRECDPAVRDRVHGVVDAEALPRSVMLGRDEIVEIQGVWKHARLGILLSDTVIRLDRVTYERRRGRAVFEGTITRRDVEHAFAADQVVIERDPAAWLRQACLEGGLGLPVVAPAWSRRLIQVAQLFHEPTFAQAEGILGWDAEGNQFVFPRFVLAMGGVVSIREATSAGNQPGLRFDPPDGLMPVQVEMLSREDDVTRLLWASVAAVAAGAIAPTLGLEPGSVAYYGPGAGHAAMPTARALGCPIVDVRRSFMTLVDRVLATRETCNWPVAITYTDERRGGDTILGLPAGVVCRVGKWTAQVLPLLEGWTIVEVDTGQVSILPIIEHGPVMIPNYLRHYCAGHLCVGDGDLVASVLEDMARWFGERGGNAHAVRRAATIIRTSDRERFADRLGELLARLYHEGDLAVTHDYADEPPPKQPAVALLGHGLIHIPRVGLARALVRRDAPQLDALLVTKQLAAADVLLDERDHRDLPGWIIRESWWSDHLRLWKARNQSTFRKVN